MATTNIDSVRNFRDLDLNFAIHPITKDVNIYKAEYAVINSVKNLILTNHFEKPFHGCSADTISMVMLQCRKPLTSMVAV